MLKRAFPEIRGIRQRHHDGSWARWGHPDLEDLDDIPGRRIAFIRNPVDWWISFYRHRTAHGWVDGHDLDEKCRASNAEAFIERVTTEMPGYAGRMFSRFVGKPGREIDFIGRQESLADDLRRAVGPIEVDFPKANTARVPDPFTDEHRAALAASEREAMDRFGY